MKQRRATAVLVGHETLLSSSNLLLYGRVLGDISIDTSKYARVPLEPGELRRLGRSRFLETALVDSPEYADSPAKLARIFGFAFEAQYYDLNPPAIFLV